jgi:hypothetical protein
VDIVIQIVGSLLVLAGFALAQWGMLDLKSKRYLTLNSIGSTILAVDALVGQQWGFLMLEAVWAIVSAAGLAIVFRRGTAMRRRQPLETVTSAEPRL